MSTFLHKTFITSLLFLFGAHFLYSQQYNFQNFSVADGIAQSQVYALMQDSSGVLWIGTRGGGITCYDGKSFKTVTTDQGIGSNYINSIVQDAGRSVWIGTNSGLTKFSNHSFISYTLRTDSGRNATVNQVYLHNKNILLATSDGLYTFINNTFIPFIKGFNLYVRTVCIYNNLVYAGTEDGIYVIGDGKTVLLKDKYGISPRSVNYLVSDGKRKLFIATNGDGVYVYEDNILRRVGEHKELTGTTVFHLFYDDNKLWISTLKNGIACYSSENGQVSWLTEAEGLCNNHIRCSIKDNAGNYWIGSSGGGLSYYKGQQFVNYHLNNVSKSNLVYSLFFGSNNSLWIGNADKGVSMKCENTFQNYNASNGFLDAKVKAIGETSHKNILLGTDGQGLYLYKNNVFEPLPEFRNKYIRSIYRDRRDNIWIATAGAGIYQLVFAGSEETNYRLLHLTVKSNDLMSDRINCLAEDGSGNIWYGTENNGLGYITNGTARSFKAITDAVRSMSVDKKGNLWVATGNGLLWINTKDQISVRRFYMKEGLTSNNLYSVITDSNNHVFAGNEKGFDQVQLNNESGISDVKHFGFQEGFTGVETTQNAVCRDNLGNIWFGTINGLTNYNINLQHAKNAAPRLQLNNIRLLYLPVKDLEYAGSGESTFRSLNLKHNENHITFDFLGVYLNNPGKVSYQWKLDGLENSWSPLSKQESVTYPNLLPGNYTFYVKAYNEDGIAASPLVYSFTIASPWWKHVWFTAAWIAVVLILLFLFYKWRVNRLRTKLQQQQASIRSEKDLLELQQKTLRLQMNPHFMFNALNSIQNNIGGGNEQTARYYLAKYSKLMRMVLENSRSNLITLEDEIKMIENYILLEKFSNDDSFDYEINTDDSIEKQEILIPPMIIQPFIENAVVHGIRNLPVKGKISISFTLTNDYLVCTVEDNGVGRIITDKEMEHKSTALVVTQERLDLLQENKSYKTIEIIDLKDNFGEPSGTKIIIKIPLQLH